MGIVAFVFSGSAFLYISILVLVLWLDTYCQSFLHYNQQSEVLVLIREVINALVKAILQQWTVPNMDKVCLVISTPSFLLLRSFSNAGTHRVGTFCFSLYTASRANRLSALFGVLSCSFLPACPTWSRE